jgi:centromere protein J
MSDRYTQLLYSNSLFSEHPQDDIKNQTKYDPRSYIQDDLQEESWGDLDSDVHYTEDYTSYGNTKQQIVPRVNNKPQPSKIAMKYFGVQPEEDQTPTSTMSKTKPNQMALQDLVDAKIQELNDEVYKLRRETEMASIAKHHFEEKEKEFRKEKEELEKFIAEVQGQVKLQWEEEQKKLQKELRVKERNQKILANHPNRREKEELESLQALQSRLQEDISLKKSRYHLNKERLKKLLQEAEGKNSQLKQEIQHMREIGKKFERPDEVKEFSITGFTGRDMLQVDFTPILPLVDESPKSSVKKDFKSETGFELSVNSEKELEKLVDYTEEHNHLYESIALNTISELKENDGRVIRSYESGHKEIIFPNGVRKEIYPNGYTVIYLANRDVKQIFKDRTVYFFIEDGTMHTVYNTGLDVISI